MDYRRPCGVAGTLANCIDVPAFRIESNLCLVSVQVVALLQLLLLLVGPRLLLPLLPVCISSRT